MPLPRRSDDTEIEELCAKARESTAADDLMNFVWLDMVGGLLHARRGEYEQAEGRTSSGRADRNNGLPPRAVVPRAYLAEVLAFRRGEEAAEVAAEAFEIFEAKGDVTGAASFARVSPRSVSKSTDQKIKRGEVDYAALLV